MNHLRVFGFIVYRHVSVQLRNKLDDKGEVIILVGHHSTGGYKLFDATKRMVLISRDVIVDEINELQQSITDYVKVVIGYNFENLDSAKTERADTPVAEA